MPRTSQTLLFQLACLLPAALILFAGIIGGLWVWAALGSMTLLVLVMDRFGPKFEADEALVRTLPSAVGVVHFLTLGTTLWAIGHSSELDIGAKVLLTATTGLYVGQVSNACAHELIHRPWGPARRLGTAIYCSVLNGHHISAHLLVHHVHAGTNKDPNSAPLGRGFYRYFLNATLAEYRAGLACENKLRHGKIGLWHPYSVYAIGACLSLCTAWFLGGGWAVVALIAISLHAQAQLMLSDYVQHYGLRRGIDASGKPEPMGVKHSWNAPQSFSSALMMNAPRHSDHHVNPMRVFNDLRLDERMPVLPKSMPVMAAVALIPPLWRRMMDHRAQEWSQDMSSLPVQNQHDLPLELNEVVT